MSQPNWVTQPSSVWTADQYSDVFHSINGLLLPGGDPWPQVASPGARQLLALAAERLLSCVRDVCGRKLLRCRGSTQAVAARRVLIGLIGTLALVRLLGDGNRQLAATASTACTIILAIATASTLLTLASGHGV